MSRLSKAPPPGHQSRGSRHSVQQQDGQEQFTPETPAQSSSTRSSSLSQPAPQHLEQQSDHRQSTMPSTTMVNTSRAPSFVPVETGEPLDYHEDDDDDADFYARPNTPPRTLNQHQHPQQLYTPAPFNGSGAGPLNNSRTPSPPPLLDHSHLRPGAQASLLSYERTLALYRENAKKTNVPEVQYEFAVFMIDAAKGLAIPTLATAGQLEIEKISDKRDDMVREATVLLKKLADRGHADSQYFLADCYANGIGTVRGRQDFDRAFPLFVLAAKHGHADAAYRAGTCCENGWGCRRESSKAVQFFRKAAAASHPGAMYRLGLAELNGELGLAKSPREGVKWLKRSAEHATTEFPHALHELALLHELGIDNVLFVDFEYSAELLAQASELGYAPSAYRLGECYEYGKMGCPQDPALSIHYYNIAAQQNHRDACFALTAWYLVGSPGVLPQSDTEAYLWAKKAAEQGLAKAQYAVGYFSEVGVGSPQSLLEAIMWYKKAAELGDKRAIQRLRNSAPGEMPNKVRTPMSAEELDHPELVEAAGTPNTTGPNPKTKDKDCIIM